MNPFFCLFPRSSFSLAAPNLFMILPKHWFIFFFFHTLYLSHIQTFSEALWSFHSSPSKTLSNNPNLSLPKLYSPRLFANLKIFPPTTHYLLKNLFLLNFFYQLTFFYPTKFPLMSRQFPPLFHNLSLINLIFVPFWLFFCFSSPFSKKNHLKHPTHHFEFLFHMSPKEFVPLLN